MTEEVGTPGRIIRVNGPIVTCEGLAGVQYHARTTRKGAPVGRYFATEYGARTWLVKMAAARAEWLASARLNRNA